MIVVSCTMNGTRVCMRDGSPDTHPSIIVPICKSKTLSLRDPVYRAENDEAPGLMGWERRERAASRQTIGESLFPTPYYLLLLHRKLNAQAAACCCKPECLNSVLLCNCAARTSTRAKKGQARPRPEQRELLPHTSVA